MRCSGNVKFSSHWVGDEAREATNAPADFTTYHLGHISKHGLSNYTEGLYLYFLRLKRRTGHNLYLRMLWDVMGYVVLIVVPKPHHQLITDGNSIVHHD